MIGIVVVSHSRALAEAAVELATHMVPADRRPRVVVAAGLDATTFGTDATAIASAITEVDSPEGTLVFLDLGSAVLAAEMSLEFVPDDIAARVRLTPAPLVEGLVAALVCAASGAPLAEVDAEARRGLLAKQSHLGEHDSPTDDTWMAGRSTVSPGSGEGSASGQPDTTAAHFECTLEGLHGLHARPAAAVVAALAGLHADVQIRNVTRSRGPVSASSPVALATLDLRHGDVLGADATGPDADAAVEALQRLAAADFGDHQSMGPEQPAPRLPVGPLTSVSGRVHRLVRPGSGPAARTRVPDDQPNERIGHAIAAVQSALQRLSVLVPADAAALVGAVAGAEAALLTDPVLARDLRRRVDEGASATEAVEAGFGIHEASFARLSDPYLRERVQDIRMLRRLVLAALGGEAILSEVPTSPHILTVDELDAVTAACLRPGATLAVLVESDATTGHGLLVASTLGVPVIIGVDTSALSDGTQARVEPSGEAHPI